MLKGYPLIIVNLKHYYDIDHIIMEFIDDRQWLQIDSSINKPMWKKHWRVDNIVEQVYRRNGLKDYSSHITDNNVDYPASYVNWIKHHIQIPERQDFFGILNTTVAVLLCNLLNIKITAWRLHPSIKYLPHPDIDMSVIIPRIDNRSIKHFKEKDVFYKFGDHHCARDYAIEKYGLDAHVCDDGIHLDNHVEKDVFEQLAEQVKKQKEEA